MFPFLEYWVGFFIIFTFPHVKTPFLTCIYLFLFLKISLCWHLLILRWKILVVVLSVLYRKGYQCPSIHCLCVSSSKSYWLPSFPSTDSCPICDLYLPLVSLSIIVFQVFPSEELWFRLLFSECADLLFFSSWISSSCSCPYYHLIPCYPIFSVRSFS